MLRVGSPPVMHTPSKMFTLFAKKSNTVDCSIIETAPFYKAFFGDTKSLLWQNGQQKLQPPRKIVAAMCPG